MSRPFLLPSISLATTLPAELLSKIVHLAGEEALLYDDVDDDDNEPNALYFADRRGGMRHLSACSLTCVYWAKVVRPRMYRILILRSIQDIHDLASLLQTSHTLLGSRSIPSIAQCLRHLVVEHQLGNWAWFHNILRLLKIQVGNHHYTCLRLDVHVDGRSFPSKKPRTIHHPLFHAMPRPVPIPQLSYKSMRLALRDTAFTDISELRNLVNDFNLKSAVWHKEEGWTLTRAWQWYTDKIYCTNITWGINAPSEEHSDVTSSADFTTIIVDEYGVELAGPSAFATGCTDNVVTVMDGVMSALRSGNRGIRFVRIEQYDVIVEILQCLRGNVLKSGTSGSLSVRMEGSWRYVRHTSQCDAELDFIVEAAPSTPTTEQHQPCGIHSIRLNTISRNPLVGNDDSHDIQQVYVRLHDGPAAVRDDWQTIIACLRRLSQLTRVTIHSSKREVLLDFAVRFKSTLAVVQNILVLSYSGEGGGGGIIGWASL